jgi:hypothetical protein
LHWVKIVCIFGCTIFIRDHHFIHDLSLSHARARAHTHTHTHVCLCVWIYWITQNSQSINFSTVIILVLGICIIMFYFISICINCIIFVILYCTWLVPILCWIYGMQINYNYNCNYIRTHLLEMKRDWSVCIHDYTKHK